MDAITKTQILTCYFESVSRQLLTLDMKKVLEAVKAIQHTKSTSGRVWIVGNGGSAATAMHFANDLQKMAKIDALALPSLVPTITAYGNDDGWENMFSNAMNSFLPGDLLFAISCSGNSVNVLKAVFAARAIGKVVGLTGVEENNALCRGLCDTVITVSSSDIKVVEDVHMAVCHAIAGMLSV